MLIVEQERNKQTHSVGGKRKKEKKWKESENRRSGEILLREGKCYLLHSVKAFA